MRAGSPPQRFQKLTQRDSSGLSSPGETAAPIPHPLETPAHVEGLCKQPHLLREASLQLQMPRTSSLGFFLSLSPSTRTLTTPDLSTISWITFPFFPITLPE